MMTLEYGQWLADHLVQRIDPFVEHVEVAGSVRRGRAQVGDIELVCRPYLNPDLFAESATPTLDELRKSLLEIGTLVKNGNRYIRAHLRKTDQYLDLFVVWEPAQWGSILAIRTGPARLGKYVVTACQENGVAHERGHAVRTETGEMVPTATEEQFFALAGLDCVAPEERDALADRVGAK